MAKSELEKSLADAPKVTRGRALRHLLHPQQLKDSTVLVRQTSLRNSVLAGMQAALTVLIVLPVMLISPWPHLVGPASLGALVALFGRFAPRRDRFRILVLCGLLQVGAVFVSSSLAASGLGMVWLLLWLAISCGLFLFLAVTGRFGAPGPLIFAFAAGATLSPGITMGDALERSAATLCAAGMALLICALTEWFRAEPSPEAPLPVEPHLPLAPRLRAAGRATIGAGIAVLISYALGAAHPAWAAMGALAVMQGAHLSISMNRALQRMAGTLVGAVLAWALLSLDPSTWSLILVLALLQLLTELVIGANYALGQMFVTPMALLMTYLAAPLVHAGAMASERVLDTILGALVGILAALIFSTLEDRLHLHRLRGG